VRVTVTSASRIKQVSLERGTQRLLSSDPAKQTQVGPNRFSLTLEGQVDLETSANMLRAVAINDGGESAAEVTVSYVPPPVRVVVERLEAAEGNHPPLRPVVGDGGRIAFPAAAPESSLWLCGRVEWSDRATQQARGASSVYVSVNGFLQLPARLEPGTGLVQPWKVRLRLNQAKDNLVTVELPELEQDSSSRTEFQLDCLRPDLRQRLHLLVVGIGARDAAGLQDRALEAVRGQRRGGERIATPAFPQGRIYGPLIGDVSRGAIMNQLVRIRIAIRAGETADAGNDVVLLYYRGAEAVESNGQFYLLTSEAADNPDLKSSAIGGTELAALFGRSPGAQVILLDVERRILGERLPGGPAIAARWPDGARIAALRCAWLRNEPAPSDARLLVVLQETLTSASRLQEIGSELSQRYRLASEKYAGELAYDQYIPSSLRNLVLAKP
jgi:hypothetical protein